jgi:hypothetical protein
MSSNQSLSNHTTAIINKEDCEKLNQSKVTRKNKTFYTHPLTQREINDSKFQKINKHCISLNDESYIEFEGKTPDISHINNIYPLSKYDNAVYEYNTYEKTHWTALTNQKYILKPLHTTEYEINDITIGE